LTWGLLACHGHVTGHVKTHVKSHVKRQGSIAARNARMIIISMGCRVCPPLQCANLALFELAKLRVPALLRMTRSLDLLSSATAEVAASAFREPIVVDSRDEILNERGLPDANPSQNQSIAVVVGRTGNGSGDGTGTEGSTVRAGSTERAQRSPPDKTAKTPSASLVGDRPTSVCCAFRPIVGT